MKKTFLNSAFIGLSLLLWTSCIRGKEYQELAPGSWRGVLEVQDKKLPFVFEVVGTDDPNIPDHLLIHNGTETIRVDGLKYKKRPQASFQGVKDTLVIPFPHYDSYLKVVYGPQVMIGEWIIKNKPEATCVFRAQHNLLYRFSTLRKPPVFDPTGRWDVTFVDTDGTEEKAIGEFKKEGSNKLTGTFLTTTGDYRFLEGEVQGDKMYLSCFDGSHAYYFEATLAANGKIINGGFLAGATYQCTWDATRNANATLPSADTLTYLNKGFDQLDFAFKNTKGETISNKDARYQNKVTLVQILGTWCPNCADETAFLTEIYKKYNPKGLEIVGLAFEKRTEPKEVNEILEIFKKRFSVPYEVLHAGLNKKAEAAKALPALNHIMSFPTLVVIDKKGKVRHIHTGFSGPATSQYQPFVTDFEKKIEGLLAE